MSKNELTKGAIAKFMNGIPEAVPILAQVIDIKVDGVNSPSTTVFVLSDGINSCRGIYKAEEIKNRVKVFDVVMLEMKSVTYVNGLAIILDELPKVVQSGLAAMIGAPEDFTTMIFRIALNNKAKVAASIPLAGNSLQEMQAIIATAKAEDYTITPLSVLTKDLANWIIKVRVTKKYEARSCKKGTGMMQKIDLVDRESTEMPLLLFDEAITSIGDTLKEGNVYFVINGKIRDAMGQTKGANNKLTIFSDRHTKIESSTEDNSIPHTVYTFVPFEELGQHKGENVDLTGRVSATGVYSKDPSMRREVILFDDKGYEINATFWQNLGSRIDFNKKPIVKIKSIYVKEYSGRLCLASHSGTQIFTELENLLKESEEQKAQPKTTSEAKKIPTQPSFNKRPKEQRSYRLLKEISKDKEKAPSTFTSTCVIQMLGDSFHYTGCPSCRKKVQAEQAMGQCPHCKKPYSKIAYIYTLSVLIADGSGQCWAQIFGDVGETMFRMQAKELVNWEELDNQWQDHPAVQRALTRKFTMRIRKKDDIKGGYKFVIESVLPAGVTEQSTGFLQRLELYYSYLQD